MNEDSALFKYELAIVAILKNEAPYIKEWIDYHFLAGVDHFYLYDNESEDNLKEILQPYIENGIVTYIFYPGKGLQLLTYNEAIKDYKFECQYMAFIDGDEFIYPRENRSIKEIFYEILALNSSAEGIAINWHIFGSSGQEKADFSKGVLERFLYRAKNDFDANKHVKSIVNPRCVELILNPHFVKYYENKCSINENGEIIPSFFSEPCTTNKIGINHYFTKSKEEYIRKKQRGKADSIFTEYDMQLFESHNKNDVFDDGILEYRAVRQGLQESRGGIENLQQINQRRFNTIINTVSQLMLSVNLSLFDNKDNFLGKLHTFLTCWAVSRDLKKYGLNDNDAVFLEEFFLKCLYKTFLAGAVEIWQLQLLIDELPKILSCKYPVVDDIKMAVKNIIPQFINIRIMQNHWISHKQLDYLLQML